MQTPFDLNKPLYFTQTAPEQPQVKRGSWLLPVVVAGLSLIALVMVFGQMAPESQSQPQESTPAATPTPQATPTPDSNSISVPPGTTIQPNSPTIATPNQQPQTSSGLPWNANVKFDGAYKVLEVHAIPSSASGIIGILEGGDAVKILSAPIVAEGTLWVCMQKAGYSGWIRSDFLEVRP